MFAETWGKSVPSGRAIAAEEVEQAGQPSRVEVQLNGVAHRTQRAPGSLFALSCDVVFLDEADDLLSGAQVLEKLVR